MCKWIRVGALSITLVAAGTAPAHAKGPGLALDQDNVPGWSLMSSAERSAHHQKLLGMKTLEECTDYMEEYRAKMEERAKERNRTYRTPRRDVCGQMKAKGLLD